MSDIQKELETIYQMISAIPVSGDGVDIMAAVRSKIRKIHADINAERNKAE